MIYIHQWCLLLHFPDVLCSLFVRRPCSSGAVLGEWDRGNRVSVWHPGVSKAQIAHQSLRQATWKRTTNIKAHQTIIKQWNTTRVKRVNKQGQHLVFHCLLSCSAGQEGAKPTNRRRRSAICVCQAGFPFRADNPCKDNALPQAGRSSQQTPCIQPSKTPKTRIAPSVKRTLHQGCFGGQLYFHVRIDWNDCLGCHQVGLHRFNQSFPDCTARLVPWNRKFECHDFLGQLIDSNVST